MTVPSYKASCSMSGAEIGPAVDGAYVVELPSLLEGDMIVVIASVAPGAVLQMSYEDGDQPLYFTAPGNTYWGVSGTLALVVSGFGIDYDREMYGALTSGIHNPFANSTTLRITSNIGTPGFVSIITFEGATTGALMSSGYVELINPPDPLAIDNEPIAWVDGIASSATDALWVQWLVGLGSEIIDDDPDDVTIWTGGVWPSYDEFGTPYTGLIPYMTSDWFSNDLSPQLPQVDNLRLSGSDVVSPEGNWVLNKDQMDELPGVLDVGFFGSAFLFQVWDDPGAGVPDRLDPTTVVQIGIEPFMSNEELPLELEPIDTPSISVPLDEWVPETGEPHR